MPADLDLDELERVLAAAPCPIEHRDNFPNWKPAYVDLIMAAVNSLPALVAEVRRLRAHFDAAAPEHNLPALLDLYLQRQQDAEAERDALRAMVERLRAGLTEVVLELSQADAVGASMYDRVCCASEAARAALEDK